MRLDDINRCEGQYQGQVMHNLKLKLYRQLCRRHMQVSEISLLL